MKWYDDFVEERIKNDRIRKYGLTEKCLHPEKDFKNMTVKELRNYVTFFCMIGYNEYLYKLIDYKTKEKIIENMNEEFNRRVGEEFVLYYNKIDKIKNNEKWNGEERYELLTYTNRKGYMEMSIVKAVKEIIELDKTKTENIIRIIDLSKNLPFWDFGYEKDSRNLDMNNPNHWKTLNYNREREVKAQDRFIDSILIVK